MSRAITILVLALGACRPDDDKDDTGNGNTGDDTGGGEQTSPIVGDWLSEGDDISPLFQAAPFAYTSIAATFVDDGTYGVTAQKSDGSSESFTGTYAVDETTTIPTVTLAQATPSEATAEGIWQVEGTTLTYEVLQTSPSNGLCSPPTPDAGFGSTDCGDYLEAGDNVQIYQRQ